MAGAPNYEITKIKRLGSGSYGEVHHVRWNKQDFAAKYLHRLLLDPHDVGTSHYRQRFEAECELLKSLSHDCIVKYIDTSIQRETGTPVLIMELCDENLTQFLEQCPSKPLPYHKVISIGLHIAQALEYLHGKGIIHRDLSSNNVLMVGNRVKVSDFGMSKLQSVNPNRSLTVCPGNSNYMSPQALDTEPTYTAKLDIFSFGVLLVQILTREAPNPTHHLRPVQGQSGVLVQVCEVERRSEHLKKIADNHALKPIIHQCLKDLEQPRPEAEDLVRSFQCLRAEEKYTQSYEKELQRICAQREQAREQIGENRGWTRNRHFWRRHRVRPSQNVVSMKLLLVGQPGVGKTCLLKVYQGQEFDHSSLHTIGVDSVDVTITYNGCTIKLSIWDSAGQEKYKALTKAYYRGAQGVLVVYDVTNQESYDLAPQWIDTTHLNAGDAEMVLVGNKTDLEAERQVSELAGRNLAQEHNIPFIETSALRNDNIQEAFSMLISNIMGKPMPLRRMEENNSIMLPVAPDPDPQRRRSCCIHRHH